MTQIHQTHPLQPDNPGMSEIQIQSKAYQYLHNNYPKIRGLLFHVPNGGSRNKIEGMQLKAAGVIPGIPDLLFITPSGKLTYIEVKKPGGICSSYQCDIHQKWEQCSISGIVAYSSTEIVQFVLSHLTITPTHLPPVA